MSVFTPFPKALIPIKCLFCGKTGILFACKCDNSMEMIVYVHLMKSWPQSPCAMMVETARKIVAQLYI